MVYAITQPPDPPPPPSESASTSTSSTAEELMMNASPARDAAAARVVKVSVKEFILVRVVLSVQVVVGGCWIEVTSKPPFIHPAVNPCSQPFVK